MPAAAKAQTLAEALVAAQAEMPAVQPDGTNPHFKNRYVTLGHLLAKVRPVLNKHGIAVAQFPSCDAEGRPTLSTVLMHESGERLEYVAPLFLPKNDPQGQGSAITYMRRYALASALGISDQDDDDGNAGSGSGAKFEIPAKAQGQSTAANGAPTVEQRETAEKLAGLTADLIAAGKITLEQVASAAKVEVADGNQLQEAFARLDAKPAAELLARLERYAARTVAA